MKLVIDHLTRYGYDEEVKFSTQYLRLTPRSTGRQKIASWTLTLPEGAAADGLPFGTGWSLRSRRSKPPPGRRSTLRSPRRWLRIKAQPLPRTR